MENVTIGLAVIAGFLSFISPCVLPLVPAYIGYMSGRMTHNIARQTAAGTTESVSLAMRLHMLLHGLAFVAGFTIVFVLVGLLTTALVSVAGQYANTLTEVIGRVGGIVIIFFGLQFMGVVPRFIRWIRKKENSKVLGNVGSTILFTVVVVGLMYWSYVDLTINSTASINFSELTLSFETIAKIVVLLFFSALYFRWMRKTGIPQFRKNIGPIILVTILMFGLFYLTVLANVAAVIELIISIIILVFFISAYAIIPAFLLVLFIMDAFTKPELFWNKFFNMLEVLIYSDTRGEIEPTGREGIKGSIFMGMVFSAGWTPCIGPLLGTILTVAATTGDVEQGMVLLTAYSLGLGIPFIITAMLLNSAQDILRRLQKHMHKIELVSGTLLIIIGIAVASGQLQSLSQSFSQGEFADFTFRVEECGIGFFEGELELNHIGSCLEGELVPVAINQSASGNFTVDMTTQQYLFHADANTAIDFEVRSVNEPLVDFSMTLYAPDDTELERIAKIDSITADSKFYPLADYTLVEEGLYRIVVTNTSTTEVARFRIKVREAEPIDTTIGAGSSLVDIVASGTIGGQDVTTIDGSPQSDTLNTLAGSAINSITEVSQFIDPATGLNEGNRAPDFTVMTDEDIPVTLSELRGNIVLLNFWGTWCGPCRREMPEFQRAYETFNDQGFEILAVANDDSFEAIATFREEFELTFLLALDDTNEINDAYGIQVRPSSFLLDKEGNILVRHFGMMTETQIQEMLEEALADE